MKYTLGGVIERDDGITDSDDDKDSNFSNQDRDDSEEGETVKNPHQKTNIQEKQKLAESFMDRDDFSSSDNNEREDEDEDEKPP